MMNRRITGIAIFLVFAAIVIWFASDHVRIPEVTFNKAASARDSVKKVMVPGKVLARDITPDGSTVTFYMTDSDGMESKVFYDGASGITTGQLDDAAKGSKVITVAGHVCGDRFHASDVYFPAY